MYFVGIDIAKKTHQAAIICSDGKLIGKPFKFPNTVDGFNLFLEKLTAVNTDLSQFEIGMEATGHYWLNLYTWLSDKSFRLHVINPLQSDALRNLYIRKTKTDSVDAKIIADVIRIGQYSETQLADENIIALRDLNRQRFYLVDMAADLKRKIIAMIPGIGTTLGATILSEIGDINRFDKPKQLIAYAGMDPSVKQSGNFVGTQSHMSKRGSPYLRRALWLAAVVAVSHNDLFKYLFQQKMNAGKTYAQAMGYICHKLLNTVFAILKTGEEYKPVYPPQIDVSKFADQPINSQL